MKKKFVFLLLLISSFIFMKVGNASNLSDYMLKKYDKVPDTFIAQIGNGKRRYDYFYVIARNSDKKFVYCIEPGESINESLLYTGFDNNQNVVANMSLEEWNKIKLYSYYGYGFENHNSLNYYAATQFLIWSVKNFGYEIFYTDGLQGNRIDKYSQEMNEINRLVNDHYNKPDLEDSYNVNMGETITLKDSRNVLVNYEVESNDYINVIKENNLLKIKGVKDGNGIITLRRKFNYYNNVPIVYSVVGSQKILSPGNLDDIVININIRVNGGRIRILKLDNDKRFNVPSGNATLKGAVYDVFDSNNNFIISLTTDNDGSIYSDKIFEVNKLYHLKERVPSEGYLLDSNVYSFEINPHDMLTTIHSYEQVKKTDITLYKVINDKSSGIMKPEAGIIFMIYNKITGEYYNRLITDLNGNINVTLPYGEWIFYQINSTYGYEIAPSFEIKVDGSQNKISKIISDKIISTNVKVNLCNKKNRKIINIDGVKFKIKNLNTGEYVCQYINYPHQMKICEYETHNGSFITPQSLDFGDYQLEQVDQSINGYVWNNEQVYFSINQNTPYVGDSEFGNIFQIDFFNEPVSGKLTLIKYGEDYYINGGVIHYRKKLLNDVTFLLYAREDIYDNEGILRYKKDTLIQKLNTRNGKILLNNLFLGKYYLIEKSTDINHIVDKEIYDFEIKYRDQYTKVVSYNLELLNFMKKGVLKIKKVDEKTKKPIYNTNIEVHLEDGIDDVLVGSYYTDINGVILLKDIPIKYGYKYYIIEKQANNNYILNNNKIYFNFVHDDIINLEITNKKKSGTVDIVVVDKDSLLPIKNSLIKIIDEKDNVIFRDYTDSDGRIYIENINYGNYRIFEEESCDGYIKDKNIYNFSISDDNKYYRLKIYNEKMRNLNKEEVVYNMDDNIENNDLFNLIYVPDTNKNIKFEIFNINYLLLIYILFSLFQEVSCVIIGKKRGI